MTRTRSRLAVGTALAALTICAAAGGAGAAGLLSSKDIRDDSIRSIDIKNETLAGPEFKDASLSATDFAGGLPNLTPGPDRVLTWTGTYESDGSTGESAPLLVSSGTIPPNSLLRATDISVTGDHSECGALDVILAPAAHLFDGPFVALEVLRSPADGGDEKHLEQLVTGPEGPTHLAIAGLCLNVGDRVVPSFDFIVTFSVTQLDLPPTTTFQ